MLPVLNEDVVRNRIAKRIALEFEDGDVVNLGIGIPTLVSNFVPEGRRLVIQTENGCLGAGPEPEQKDYRFRRSLSPSLRCCRPALRERLYRPWCM